MSGAKLVLHGLSLLPDDTLTPADTDGDPDIGPVIAAFGYDGLGRRVSKVVTNSGSWNDEYDYYYDGWKLIETRNTDSDICGQYLWGLGYIDELCLIRWQFDALSVRQTRDYYALQDANYNVLGVVDADGDLVERYDYTPYGERRVYNHHHIVLSDYDDDGDVDLTDFITCNQNFGLDNATHDQGDSNGDGVVDLDDFILMKQEYGYVAQTGDSLLYQSANESLKERGDIELCPFGHQGLMFDKEFGQYYNRARYLHPVFGRFMSNDPKDQNTPGGGYHDGMNRFEYEKSSPIILLDPTGMYCGIPGVPDPYSPEWDEMLDIPRPCASTPSTFGILDGPYDGLMHYLMGGGTTAELSNTLINKLKQYYFYRDLIEYTIPKAVRAMLPADCDKDEIVASRSGTLPFALTSPIQPDPSGKLCKEPFYSFELNNTIGTINSIRWKVTCTIGSSAAVTQADGKCCCLSYAKACKVELVLDDLYTFNTTGIKDKLFQWTFGDFLGGEDFNIHNEWCDSVGPETKKICK